MAHFPTFRPELATTLATMLQVSTGLAPMHSIRVISYCYFDQRIAGLDCLYMTCQLYWLCHFDFD